MSQINRAVAALKQQGLQKSSSGKFLNMRRTFLVRRNIFCQFYSFYKSFFHKHPENEERFSLK